MGRQVDRPRRALVGALAAILLTTACGGGDTDDATTAASGDDGVATSTLRIVEKEYGYEVSGEPVAGRIALTVANEGTELHEVDMARLLDGKTVDDVKAALAAAGEDDRDPLAGIAEAGVAEDLGGIHAPGTSYTVTSPSVEIAAGDYVLLCHIPNADGVSHYDLGMIGQFTVAEAGTDPSPEGGASTDAATVELTATADGLDGPAELPAGRTRFEVVNDTDVSREITMMKVADGKTWDEVGAWFEQADQGPPDFSTAPLEFFTFVFDSENDRAVEVDLTAGQWAIGAPDPENPFDGPPLEDPHALVITVE